MVSIIRFALALSLLTLGLGCQSRGAEETANTSSYDFVIPKDAQGIVKGAVGPTNQIAFAVQRKYPAFAFGDETIAALGNQGWKKCTSPSDEWSSFMDMTSGTPARIHQKVLHLKKDDQVLVLAGRYSSPAPSRGFESQTLPTSDRQSGNVIAIKGKPAELEEALKTFQARC